MTIQRTETKYIRSSEDLLIVRQTVREFAVNMQMSLIDQTKIVTAASELGRNAFIYGGGGKLIVEQIHNGTRTGLRLTFEDKGPGIPDINLALQDGYTTSGGMGLGLGGAKRLSNEFHINSVPGEGTVIIIIRWK